MRRMIWALAAVALVGAGPAFAGAGEKGQLELGGYLGYGWLDNYGVYNPKNHVLYGGRLGYFLSSKTSLEFSAQRLPTETDFENPLLLPNIDAHLSAYRLNLLYHLGSGNVRPFLTGGVGSEKFSVKDAAETETRDFGWNAGGGLRFGLGQHWNLRLEGRYVSTKAKKVIDESQKNVEATAGLSLMLGGHKAEHAEAITPNQPPTVSCAADRAQILPGETANITATGSDPEGRPLTYSWTTTSGRVTGNGATASLDFTGVNPPASATVTVHATDDHGGTATSDCSVALMEAAKPAESVSCTAGGFPRNLSRVGNVDKACLDDVAQRLSADPRAHVVIIGHADTGEKPTDLGQRRADAAKDYLVKERNIDATRVTTRTAAAGVDVATTGNRRVEVWFVPEGAKEP